MFHRMPSDTILWFINNVKREHGKKIVWHLDDDLWNIGKWMPNSEFFEDKTRLSLCADLADMIIVSTENLAKVVNKPDKTVVLPLLIDPAAYDNDAHPQLADEPLRILWCGSMFHERDLNLIVEPIKQLAKDYQHRVRFIFWGYLPDEFAYYVRSGKGQDTGKMVVKPEYEHSISFYNGLQFRYFSDQLVAIRPHIGLAPLEDTFFNQSKSNLKYLEYTMANAAVVASDVAPYKCIKNGHNGLVVPENKPEAWYNAIKELIESNTLRQKLTTNAWNDIRRNWCWNDTLGKEQWVDAFRRMARL